MKQSHFDFATLYQAWQTCRRGKRGTRKAQRYEIGLLDNLVNTAQALQQKSWHPSRASRFVTLHPKPREILAAEFGDRVVHHVLVPWFEKHFEPVFIHDSFANRCGKGTHAAVDRLQTFTRAYSRDPASTPLSQRSTPLSQRCHAGWYLQLDIANFFNSIDRRTLFGMLHSRIAHDLRRPPSDAVQATLASYWGHFRHARARRLRAQAFARHTWLRHILKPMPDGTLQRVDRPGIVTSLASQWTYFRARYPQHVLLVQVGNRWECQGPQGNEIPSTFRRQSAQRRSLPQTWAVPAAQVPALKRQLTRKGQPWCEVCENGFLPGGMKRRQLVALWPVFAPSGTPTAEKTTVKVTASIPGKLP